MMLYKIYESNSSLTRLWHQLLRHCRWYLARWSINIIYAYNLPRLRTTNVSVVLDKSWKQHPTKQQLYGHLPPVFLLEKISGLISDVLLWTPYTWTRQSWPTNKDLLWSARYGHWIQSREPARSDRRWWERGQEGDKKREGGGRGKREREKKRERERKKKEREKEREKKEKKRGRKEREREGERERKRKRENNERRERK